MFENDVFKGVQTFVATIGDSCRYALLDLRASFWRQSRISNKYFCDSPTRGFSVLGNRAYSM